MNGGQQFVALGGGSLVLANFWFGGARATVTNGILKPGTPAGITAGHGELKKVGAELLFVGVGAFLAGLDDNIGVGFACVVVALWILWLINHKSSGSGGTTVYGGGDFGPNSPQKPSTTGGGSWFTAPSTKSSGLGRAV